MKHRLTEEMSVETLLCQKSGEKEEARAKSAGASERMIYIFAGNIFLSDKLRDQARRSV